MADEDLLAHVRSAHRFLLLFASSAAVAVLCTVAVGWGEKDPSVGAGMGCPGTLLTFFAAGRV